MNEQGVFTYACPMPPQNAQPWIPQPFVPIYPFWWPVVEPTEPKPQEPQPDPADWAGPSIEQDLHEAERLFEIAVKRVRAAIAKHRAKEGT